MINSEEEVWKSHPEYAGVEVSTLGNVRTLDRLVSCKGNRTRLVKGRVLKPWDNGNGYLQVSIKADGKFIKQRVNRLVARTFLSNPDNLPEVNHKDNNRTNNNVDNLEFCTRSYNRQYREKYGETSGIPVFAVNLSTLEVSRFESQIEASRVLGFSDGNINCVIKERLNQTHGFWFVNDDGHAVDVVKSKLHDIGGTGLKI